MFYTYSQLYESIKLEKSHSILHRCLNYYCFTFSYGICKRLPPCSWKWNYKLFKVRCNLMTNWQYNHILCDNVGSLWKVFKKRNLVVFFKHPVHEQGRLYIFSNWLIWGMYTYMKIIFLRFYIIIHRTYFIWHTLYKVRTINNFLLWFYYLLTCSKIEIIADYSHLFVLQFVTGWRHCSIIWLSYLKSRITILVDCLVWPSWQCKSDVLFDQLFC